MNLTGNPIPGMFTYDGGSFPGSDFKSPLDFSIDEGAKGEGEKKSEVSDFQSLINLFRDPAYRKGVMQDTLAFQKEQMAEAGKYRALFGLPQQIMDSFTIPAAIAATGDIAAANTLAVAGRNIGQMYAQGVKSQQVNVPTTNYGFRSR